MVDARSIGSMWSAFLLACPDIVGPDDVYSAWHFCDNKEDADTLAELARSGRKRATAGTLYAYEAEGAPLPRAGDLSVITDWEGRARCVVRTMSVEVVPFEEVTEEFAATEGEGDGSLACWREAHWAAFARELAEIGRAPTLEMPVVCERFEVVFGGTHPISDA